MQFIPKEENQNPAALDFICIGSLDANRKPNHNIGDIVEGLRVDEITYDEDDIVSYWHNKAHN